MKKIIKRKSGQPVDDIYEARALVKQVKSIWPMVQVSDHRAPHGKNTSIIARRSDLGPILDAHHDYIWLYIGAEYCGSQGYKALFIGFKELPSNFEARFHDYIIIGE